MLTRRLCTYNTVGTVCFVLCYFSLADYCCWTALLAAYLILLASVVWWYTRTHLLILHANIAACLDQWWHSGSLLLTLPHYRCGCNAILQLRLNWLYCAVGNPLVSHPPILLGLNRSCPILLLWNGLPCSVSPDHGGLSLEHSTTRQPGTALRQQLDLPTWGYWLW